jgi:hypothetical protein
MTDALTTVAVEIEQHASASGWDQPPRLYALVPTAELVEKEPAAAAQLGIVADGDQPDALTPIEQDDLPDGPLDEVLAGIAWPPEVAGCALIHEAVVLPPDAENEAPADDEEALAEWAAAHPDRRDIRIAVAVLRDGSTAAALRVRAADDEGPDEVVTGDDLAPNLAEALLATLT